MSKKRLKKKELMTLEFCIAQVEIAAKRLDRWGDKKEPLLN